MRTVSPMVVTKSRNPVTVFVTKLVFPEVANFLSQSNRMLEDVSSSTESFGSLEIPDSVEVSSLESTEKMSLKRSDSGKIQNIFVSGLVWCKS